jgi:hypothetical protein
MFHPVDLMIEFAVPVLVVLSFQIFVVQDPLCLFVTYLTFQLLYAWEHDEFFEKFSWHGRHHAACDSVYVIYTGGKDDPRSNLLRQHMRTLDIEWPTSRKRSPSASGTMQEEEKKKI